MQRMDAIVLRCQSCGGTLTEGAGECPFCHATVAARHCLACFHANLASAVHCAACGRELGLEPLPDPDTMRCPSCPGEAHFVALPAGANGTVHECPRCTGQFVDHATLRALFAERTPLSLGVPRAPQSAPQGPVRYLPCPVCHARMNRKNFGERSGVIVDVCKSHGIWFDHGELPRVLAWVEEGGLQDLAQREEQRRRETAREAAISAMSLHGQHLDLEEDRRDVWSELWRVLFS